MKHIWIALCLAAGPAHADFFDGNDLHDMCQKMPVRVDGYVAGVYDRSGASAVLSDFWAPNPESKAQLRKVIVPFCVPDGVRLSQLRDVTCKYLADFPQKRHMPGSLIVVSAVGDAFPCK